MVDLVPFNCLVIGKFEEDIDSIPLYIYLHLVTTSRLIYIMATCMAKKVLVLVF